MKIKTSELIGPALDWAVAKCEGADELHFGDAEQFLLLHSDFIEPMYHFCDDWSQGGPIIEREWIEIVPWPNESEENLRWQAAHTDTGCEAYGRTPLIAAMRCFVASKLGDIIDVPKELA